MCPHRNVFHVVLFGRGLSTASSLKRGAALLQIIDEHTLKQSSACAKLWFSFQSYHAILGKGERYWRVRENGVQ